MTEQQHHAAGEAQNNRAEVSDTRLAELLIEVEDCVESAESDAAADDNPQLAVDPVGEFDLAELRSIITELQDRRARPAAPEGEWVVKPLDDDQIMEVIRECFPWQTEAKINDLLTREKSPPLFPQATYDVPSYRANRFVRAIEQRIRSTLSAAPKPNPASAPTHRHKNRGTEYALIGIGKMQAVNWFTDDDDGSPMCLPSVDMREVAIYRSVDDGSWWVRPREEFEDGRFEALSQSQPAAQPDADWRCSECGGRTYALADERKPDGSWGPSDIKRCVECKTLDAPQPDAKASGVEGWEAVETAPWAATVLAAYFDHSVGEWVVGIFVAERPQAPFTHWRYLPPMPDALTPSTEAGVEEPWRAMLAQAEADLTAERERSARLREALESAERGLESASSRMADGEIDATEFLQAAIDVNAALRELKGGE